MKVTAFVDVLSHWCLAAYPAVTALAGMLAEDVEFELLPAPIRGTAPLPYSAETEAWFFDRGALAYGRRLSSAWYEQGETSWHANAAVVAALRLAELDRVALIGTVMRGAMVDELPFCREVEVARFVAGLAGVSVEALLAEMRGDDVVGALHGANARLSAAGCGERPSWVLANGNGDKAVLQGVWQAEAVLPLARALLDDERAYARAGAAPA